MKKEESGQSDRLCYLLVIENRMTADRQGCLPIYGDSEDKIMKVARSVAKAVKKATGVEVTLYKPIKEW